MVKLVLASIVIVAALIVFGVKLLAAVLDEMFKDL